MYRRKSRLTNLVEENLLLMEKATESLKQLKPENIKTEKKKREQAQTGYSFERNCVPCGNLPYGQFAG